MRQIGGEKNFNPVVDVRKMQNIPVDCVWEGSEKVESEKLSNGTSMCHNFAKLQDPTVKFSIWGFGGIDSKLRDKSLKEGTPVRLAYKGKSEATVQIKDKKGRDKDLKTMVHQIDVSDITDEVESKEIKETTSQLVYA